MGGGRRGCVRAGVRCPGSACPVEPHEGYHHRVKVCVGGLGCRLVAPSNLGVLRRIRLSRMKGFSLASASFAGGVAYVVVVVAVAFVAIVVVGVVGGGGGGGGVTVADCCCCCCFCCWCLLLLLLLPLLLLLWVVLSSIGVLWCAAPIGGTDINRVFVFLLSHWPGTR